MILLDADILLLDIRYPRDARFGTNERLLKTLQERGLARGITLYALLKVPSPRPSPAVMRERGC